MVLRLGKRIQRKKSLDTLTLLEYIKNMIPINTIPLRAVTHPQHFVKFSATRISRAGGNRESGDFQIHSSTRLFSVFAVKQPDGSYIGNYHGGETQRLRLAKEKDDTIKFICSMYGVGGQSLTSDDGVQFDDGSWIYNGSYDCWSD